MHRLALLVVLGLVVALLGGCATPVGVRRVDERAVHHTLTANALSAGKASVSSRQVLLRLGLSDRYRHDPEGALAALHEQAVRETTSARLFALAEYSFLHAGRSGAQPYFVAASIYAYAFLFPDEGEGVEAPGPFDPRLRTAVDLYNRAVASALVSDAGEVVLRDGAFPFHLGTLELAVDPEGFRWADRRLENFVPAAELEVRGLRNRYRRTGLGAPFIAEPEAIPGHTVEITNARIPEETRVPVTFVVRYADPVQSLRSGRFFGAIELYSQDDAEAIELAGQHVPLEYETTSALAYSLEGSALWDFEIAGYLRGDELPVEDGLLMVRPWVPGRIPLVLVHGTASSPARWAELLNELGSDPRLADRYQVWLFLYTTGNPILYSAKLLRDSLRGIVAELDPEGRDLALRRMIVMGHSQGGLLTRLQVVSSGDRFWHNISEEPFEAVPMKPSTRELLASTLFFEPLPFVERAVFISTPHRGSFLAGNWLGRIASSLFTAPQNLVGISLDLARSSLDLAGNAIGRVRDGVDIVTGDDDARLRRELGRVPSSVDNMNPGDRFIRTLASIPLAPPVTAHSIIPVTGGPPPEGQDDGVVAWSSAHIEGVASEYVVYHSGHSTQAHPETIQEVRRILFEHLGTDGAAAATVDRP